MNSVIALNALPYVVRAGVVSALYSFGVGTDQVPYRSDEASSLTALALVLYPGILMLYHHSYLYLEASKAIILSTYTY